MKLLILLTLFFSINNYINYRTENTHINLNNSNKDNQREVSTNSETKSSIKSNIDNITKKTEDRAFKIIDNVAEHSPNINETSKKIVDYSKEKFNNYKDNVKDVIGEESYNKVTTTFTEIKQTTKELASDFKDKTKENINTAIDWFKKKKSQN